MLYLIQQNDNSVWVMIKLSGKLVYWLIKQIWDFGRISAVCDSIVMNYALSLLSYRVRIQDWAFTVLNPHQGSEETRDETVLWFESCKTNNYNNFRFARFTRLNR